MGNFLTDNPELYERRFPDPDHRAARFAHDVIGRFGGGTRVLDIGCGTGRDAGYLARLGYEVTAVDLSRSMLAFAAARHNAVDFQHGDMRAFDIGRTVDVVTCLDSTMLYCHTDADLRAFLDNCHAHLAPGGLLIAEMRNGAFFLGNTELLNEVTVRTVAWDGIAYTARTRLWIDHANQLLRRHRIWTWAELADPVVEETAWRLLFPLELRAHLAAAGFDVLALFDEPGPRTDVRWAPDAVLSTALSGDRLHLVARSRPR
ncbi:class I SAM-dependent methyltransferase [Actinokineospora cianjurensis]|uniref:Methyltransferase family protein n=1 Tax=Actinokineospora cianjurensis TaxID=585224 RepID=A0A421B4Z5_9PSEU|nr:class I SAM-dependent methyltransferase [Actinokineospora cianjurensis]RLK59318.1 methyltransferase family protein [Actinokineospora cianjurensis]